MEGSMYEYMYVSMYVLSVACVYVCMNARICAYVYIIMCKYICMYDCRNKKKKIVFYFHAIIHVLI